LRPPRPQWPLSRLQQKEVDAFGKSPILPLGDFASGIGARLSGEPQSVWR
jgi:hypothetical protein